MSLFSEIDKIFKEETPGGNRIAKFENLMRINEPELPIPGLKRYCEANSRFRKLIVETTGSRAAAKRFLIDIDIAEIKEVPCQPKSVLREEVQVIAKGEVLLKQSSEKTQEFQKEENSRLPQPPPRKVSEKKGISAEERARRSARMKEYWKNKKSENAKVTNVGSQR